MAQIDNYKWLNQIPEGWKELARKMIEECEKTDTNFEIIDLKEKWGMICMCAYPCSDEIIEIEHYYERLSARTCCICGKPATKYSTGWICPYCDDCGDKDEKFYKRFNYGD